MKKILFNKNFTTKSLTFKEKKYLSSFSLAKNTYVHKPGRGSVKNVTVIPGIGIGPEITSSVIKIFQYLKFPINFDIINNFCLENPTHKELIKKNEAILLGVISPQLGSKYSENMELFKYLKTYVNVVGVNTIPGIHLNRFKDIDIAIIRENTEGEYSGIEHEVYPGVMESIKITTREKSLQAAEYAFEFAYLSGRKKVTAVHKANIMKICDGMFLKSCREVAKKFPFIKYEEMIIDNCSMQLVKNPTQFDVMVMPNLYGSIIINICAGITGGAGTTPGACIGNDFALFGQGTRHSGYDISGQNIVNPTAIILSSIMMLRYLRFPKFAEFLSEGLDLTLSEGKVLTKDVGGNNLTNEFTDEVIKNSLKIMPFEIK